MSRLLFFTVFCCFIKGYTANLCNSYSTLPYTRARSIFNTADHTPSNPICDDKLVPGWYAMEYFASIPTSCPASFSCGTLLPVWINGSNPGTTDGPVTMQGCVNSGVATSCCSSVFDIGVRNCGSFFIYFLRPTPGCPLAYCSDFKELRSTTVGTTLTTAGSTLSSGRTQGTPQSTAATKPPTKPSTVGPHWITFPH
ncbi:oncoprotein-induced transcript 3 protein-like [Pecten maximus]|uniref:oncoprotein-induced transcript 3 protein-like n=1 Tax=Pecten maximus TaxID=6579 RepID=UPI001458D5F4|nr:oncoprotein-induced transcript 3 protein-like [Pecten maximus]XP_033764313.1 oncoprotein-induced transcript 3 protein-like [Pecten maximus]